MCQKVMLDTVKNMTINASIPTANHKHGTKEFNALAASVTALFHNINVMVAYMGAKIDNEDDTTPSADGRMGANAKNPKLTKNQKKEKEQCQTLSNGYISTSNYSCPIVSVKSLDSPEKIRFMLNLALLLILVL